MSNKHRHTLEAIFRDPPVGNLQWREVESLLAAPKVQAVRGQRKVHDPFDLPGEIDLTSRVDFAPLIRAFAATGCRTAGPVPQGEFLGRLGIELRTEALARGLDEDRASDLWSRTHRLVDPNRMGRTFKVLGVAAPGQALPPGLVDEGAGPADQGEAKAHR